MSEPATKDDLVALKDEFRGDLVALKDEVRGDLVALKDEVRGDLLALKDELVEAFRDGQTELLTAFYGFMQTVQTRFQEDDLTEASLKRRMTTLESRILEIEKRLNLPPAA